MSEGQTENKSAENAAGGNATAAAQPTAPAAADSRDKPEPVSQGNGASDVATLVPGSVPQVQSVAPAAPAASSATTTPAESPAPPRPPQPPTEIQRVNADTMPAGDSGLRMLAPPPDSPFGQSAPEIDFPSGPSGPEQDKMVKSIYMPVQSGILPRVVFGKAPAAPVTAVLAAQGLKKSFGRREVVRGVDIEVGMGEIVGLLGRNGAGKTTTFRMIMGLLQPDGGTVTYESREITRLPMYKRANRGIGYLAQQPSIFQRMTVEENLLAILELQERDRAKRAARLEELVHNLGLQTVRKSIAAVLSGGERRRLEIARAMSLRPRIILFDEPFAGIDPIAVSEIQGILRELKSNGVGVLLTDHNVRETLNITDRTYIMDEGKIWIHGPPREIVANAEARARYLGHDFRLDF